VIDAALVKARAKLDHERARIARSREVVKKPGPGIWWRPTPTPFELSRQAIDPGDIVMNKVWDLSPIDPNAFDPTPGPMPGPPPANTTAPSIAFIAGVAVGDALAGIQGTWTGSPTYTRQWLRDGVAIAGAVNPSYTLATVDIGAMIGLVVVGANPNGSTSASAEAVGPVTETRLKKAR
jgi:hypothetical protein